MKKILPLVVIALIAIPMFVGAAQSRSNVSTAVKPSIVLVHGAWADGSSWSGVVRILQDEGFTVYVPSNPLRGLTSDSMYLASFLHSISGPIILAGHSYGGAVITNAATGNPNVKGLVYVDAFAPDKGETLQGLTSVPPPPGVAGSCLDPATSFNFVPIPGDVDLYIKQGVYPSCFANTIPLKEAMVLAASQRPFAFSSLTQPSGVPAWKTIPSWYAVGTLDLVIPPFAQFFMAQRIHATIVEVRGPHPSMITQPEAIADLIQQAAQTEANSDPESQVILAPTAL